MKCFTILVQALFALQTSAQHVHYRIPEVSSVVSSIKARYTEYIHFDSETTTPLAAAKVNTMSTAETISAAACAPYWLDQMTHQGVASFNPDRNYQVYRNVKDYGARGDGVTDDTAAINAAISSGNRCAPGCESSTTSPATVYFPPGTYIVSSSIINNYYTNLIGHPSCPPVLKATAGFVGMGVIDGNKYQPTGRLGHGATNTFFRQIRNFVIDTTGVPPSSAMTGIHWPTAQATSIQYVEFLLSSVQGTQHQGLFIEEGSGGYLGDLVFRGGLYAMNIGNQQFTSRNIAIHDAVTAINQLWDWGWTYSSLSITNCSVGIDMTAGGRTSQQVNSINIIDSSFTNTPVGIITSRDTTSLPPGSGSIILENVAITNVPTIIRQSTGRTVYAGTTGSLTIAAWGEGHYYSPSGPNEFERTIRANSRPAALTVSGGKYYAKSKPQYETYSASKFVSVRSAGAKGDGVTDDTSALQSVINSAKAAGQIVFFDAGYYKVTRTLKIPAGSRIVGESYPVIMSSGSFFNNINSPKTVVQIGNSGETGRIEWSDMIVSTQGQQAGAVLIGHYLSAPSGNPSGMWDVHTRIGGFAGSNLQVAQCPTTPGTATPPATPKASCISGFMGMHVAKSASGLYMENCWIWTADHDLDDSRSTQITIYSGRGLLVDSTAGSIWLVGTGVEHFSLYQYQFANTANVYMGMIQTETAYYQPNPDARIPFSVYPGISDPTFTASSASNSANGWGLRIVNSTNVLTYGAGLYSFFDNYSTACSQTQLNQCQTKIFSVEGTVSNIVVYGLNTVGTSCQVTRNGNCAARAVDNLGQFVDTIALYRAS